MPTYQWQTFQNNFPGDGTTPLDQNTLNLYTIPEGSRIRRTLFHCQLSCQIESAAATDLPVDLVPRVVLAAGLWLGDTSEPAANSPSVIDDANTATWLFWDALQERVDTDAVADTGVYRIVWETPPGGLDIATSRIAQAGISNDLWLGWQFNSDFGFLNNSTDTWNAYVSGYFTIRFLIYTP
jgi:hypothetical protein